MGKTSLPNSKRRQLNSTSETSSRQSKRRSLRWMKRKQGPRAREQRQKQRHRGSNSPSAHQIPSPAASCGIQVNLYGVFCLILRQFSSKTCGKRLPIVSVYKSVNTKMTQTNVL